MAAGPKCEECGLTPIYVSWSSLRNHEECRARTSLRSKRSQSANIRMFFPGTVVDRVMRAWLDDEDRSPGQMAAMVADIMDREELEALTSGDGVVRWRNKSDRDSTLAWCQELVRRLEPILDEIVIPKDFEPSRRFRVPVKLPGPTGEAVSVVLVGETDILTRDAQGVFDVWDLKGTADDNYWRKTMGQLIFYDLAVFGEFGAPTGVTGLIQPMCKQPVLRFTITTEQRRALLQRIARMVADILTGDMPPNETTKFCTFCSVRHACPKFTPVGTTGRVSLLAAGQAPSVSGGESRVGGADVA